MTSKNIFFFFVGQGEPALRDVVHAGPGAAPERVLHRGQPRRPAWQAWDGRHRRALHPPGGASRRGAAQQGGARGEQLCHIATPLPQIMRVGLMEYGVGTHRHKAA